VTTEVSLHDALDVLIGQVDELKARVQKLDETLALVVTHIGADNLNVTVAARDALAKAYRERRAGYLGGGATA
jgi:hypothetical protein